MSVNQENPNPQPSPEDELPDWLKEIRGEAPAAAKPTLPPAAELPQDTVADIEELPAWLQDVPEEIDMSEVERAEPEAMEPETEAASEDTSGTEMWQKILVEEGVSLDNVSEERPEDAEDMSVADYMEATAGVSAQRLAQAAQQPISDGSEPPVVDEAPAEPVAEAVDDGMVINHELPDWLKDDTVTEADAEPVAWLTDESIAAEPAAAEPAPAETADEAPVETVPNWLQVGTTAEPVADAADDGMVIDDELPDWLKDETIAETDTEPETPSWLSDESIITSAAEVRAAVGMVEEPAAETDETADLPDWLQEDADIEPELEAETPSWLTDEGVVDEPVAEVNNIAEFEASEEPALEVDESFVDETADLPDWLQEDAGIEPELEAETPSWLTDETVAEADESFEDEMDIIAGDEVVAEALVVDDELPDWLKEDALEAEAEVDAEAPAWLMDETTAEEPVADIAAADELLDAEGLPDWLQEGEEMWAETADEPAEAVTATTAAIDAEAPDWLSEAEVVVEPETTEPEPIAAQTLEAAGVEVAAPEASDVKTVEEPVSTATSDVFEAARKALEVGQLNDALQGFNTLIAQSAQLGNIVRVLSDNLNVFTDNPAIYETLGDAQTRLGQLNRAFQSYKTALQKL